MLITSHDPRLTLGEGVKAHYPTMLAAANAFAQSAASCKTVIYDDCCEARELDAREQAMLERVRAMLGLDVTIRSSTRVCPRPRFPLRGDEKRDWRLTFRPRGAFYV